METKLAAVRIRPAERAEARLLTEVAHEAKRHWRYPERWVATWRETLTLTEDLVAGHPTMVAERDGAVAGFYALREHGDRWSLEHLWVRPRFMGQGVGRALLTDAVARVRRGGGRILSIEADPNAEGFYLALGARRVGQVPADPDGNDRVLPCLQIDVTADADFRLRGEP